MAPSDSHWDRRVGNRHLRVFNLPLQHHHFGPREDADRWKHRTLGQRDRLSWLARWRESRQHEASAPLVTVIVIAERAR